MPILTFTLKGDELKHHTVNLHKPLNLRYFKLLHVSTNISSANLNIKGVKVSGDHPHQTYSIATIATEQALMFLRLSFLNSDDVSFYERSADGTQYVHNVFSIGDTALGDRRIESKDLFKMLTTRPIQVHQPFTIEMYAFDTTVTAHTDATVTAARNQLRPLKDINTGSIPKDIFLTLSFEYDEYDTAPRTH